MRWPSSNWCLLFNYVHNKIPSSPCLRNDRTGKQLAVNTPELSLYFSPEPAIFNRRHNNQKFRFRFKIPRSIHRTVRSDQIMGRGFVFT